MLSRILRAVVVLPILLVVLWAAAALWVDGPASRAVAGVLVACLLAGCLAAALRVRPFVLACIAVLALVAVVALWWSSITPSSAHDWQTDVARVASAEIAGDRVTIHNLRNFDYRSETDYTPHWEDRTVDLSKLNAVDLFISFWGPTAIAHTILSFEFADALPIAFSIETRKAKGQEYSALLGFFKQYTLIYVVADERDLIRLRTNYRGEDVYLYRLPTPPERGRRVFLDYLKQVNRLAEAPQFYNALTHNCTTGVRMHFQTVGNVPFDWRILANGYLDRALYERGVLDTSLPFDELKRRSYIDPVARAADQDPAFSARIRAGLPRFGQATSSVAQPAAP